MKTIVNSLRPGSMRGGVREGQKHEKISHSFDQSRSRVEENRVQLSKESNFSRPIRERIEFFVSFCVDRSTEQKSNV